MLNAELKNYKQARLKRSIPLDSQLLDCAKQDIEIKKRIIDQMDKMDKEYCENMTSLSANMDKHTNSIADGFSLLKKFNDATAAATTTPPTKSSVLHDTSSSATTTTDAI